MLFRCVFLFPLSPEPLQPTDLKTVENAVFWAIWEPVGAIWGRGPSLRGGVQHEPHCSSTTSSAQRPSCGEAVTSATAGAGGAIAPLRRQRTAWTGRPWHQTGAKPQAIRAALPEILLQSRAAAKTVVKLQSDLYKEPQGVMFGTFGGVRAC